MYTLPTMKTSSNWFFLVLLNPILFTISGKISTTIQRIYIWKPSLGRYDRLYTFGDEIKLKPETSRIVRVIADNMPPYITSRNGSRELGGYLGDVWTVIATALQFKTEVATYDYDAGVERMMNKEADVMLAAAVEKPGQANIVYSQPYFYNWYHLYTKMPEARASSHSYTKIFSKQLWLATFGLIVIMTLSLWTSLKCSRNKRESGTSIFTCLLIVCSGFLNQGFDLKPRTCSGRIQVILSLVIGYLLYSAMNAVLVARLANLEVRLPFSDLYDIADRRTHSLCLRTNSFVYNNFTFVNRTILPKWDGILNGPGCLDIINQTNLARILCDENLIFLENRVVMSTVIKNNDLPCQITFHPKVYFKSSNSFILLEEFHYKRTINTLIKHLRSTGILSRLESKWIKKYNQPKSDYTLPQVTLHHVSAILQFFFIIIGCTLTILFLELLYYKHFEPLPYVN